LLAYISILKVFLKAPFEMLARVYSCWYRDQHSDLWTEHEHARQSAHSWDCIALQPQSVV